MWNNAMATIQSEVLGIYPLHAELQITTLALFLSIASQITTLALFLSMASQPNHAQMPGRDAVKEGTSSIVNLGPEDGTQSPQSHQPEVKNLPETGERDGVYGLSGLCDYLLKYSLFTSNLLFTALGLVTLVLGLWGLVAKESFAQEKIGGIGTDPMFLFVFLGFVLSLLCLTGCVGALRENSCLLRSFSAAVLILVTAQVLVAIVAYSLQGQIVGLMRSGILAAMVRYQDDLDLRFITDEIQTGLQCCGADNYRDWEINIYFNCSAPGIQACSVPPSCCVDPMENGTVWNSQCGVGAQQLDEFSAQSVIFLGGCLGGMSRWIQQHSGLIGTVAIVLLGVQILTLIVTARLLDKIQWSKAIARQAVRQS
ncbi:tetraspanin-10 [Chanos chanos]|uniref:Tetraspanin-10 n=1 Tax=Chanos chanos TaxID=29144 RepID=A0A6J2WJ46_CHACN|nr:tetraspanin-10-like [Chanos chanos]